jgi:hypothetical protein
MTLQAECARLHIPSEVYEAITVSSCLILPQRDGFMVIVEPTVCPGCGQMRAFFDVRQIMPHGTWTCACWVCSMAWEPEP